MFPYNLATWGQQRGSEIAKILCALLGILIAKYSGSKQVYNASNRSLPAPATLKQDPAAFAAAAMTRAVRNPTLPSSQALGTMKRVYVSIYTILAELTQNLDVL